MNDLIKWVASEGLSNDVYSTMGTIGFAISFIYSIFHGKKYGISLWKMPIILCLTYGGTSLIQNVISVVLDYIRRNHIFGIQTTTMSIVRIFVFIPLIVFPLAKLLKIKWSKACDAVALFPLLMSGINQLPCIFPGCCAGYEIGWGIYNPITNGYHFPTPILETILTLMIFAYLVYRTSKKKHVSDGTLYPLMMILYGIMRFVCEMLRDNEKIVLGQSAMGIHSIFMCLVGLVALYLIKNKRAKEVAPALEVGEITEEDNSEQLDNKVSVVEDAVPAVKQSATKKIKKQKVTNKRKTKIKKKKKKKK